MMSPEVPILRASSGCDQPRCLRSWRSLTLSFYLMITAFYRYRGLFKDLESTGANQAIYFLRVTVAVFLLLSALTMLRAGVARFRRSRTPTAIGL